MTIESIEIFSLREQSAGIKEYIHDLGSNPDGHESVRLVLDGTEQNTRIGRNIVWNIDRSSDGVVWIGMIKSSFETGTVPYKPRSMTTSIPQRGNQQIRVRVNMSGNDFSYGATLIFSKFGERE